MKERAPFTDGKTEYKKLFDSVEKNRYCVVESRYKSGQSKSKAFIFKILHVLKICILCF